MKRLVFTALAAGLLAAMALPSMAHPMGNFAICHYARFESIDGKLKLRYLLDFAEIPTVTEMESLDSNRDSILSTSETKRYLDIRCRELGQGLLLKVDGKATKLSLGSCDLVPGQGAAGMKTLKVRMNLEAQLPSSGGSHEIEYRDENYRNRVGWKEIVLRGGSFSSANVGAIDRSRELAEYPASVTAPNETEARFTVGAGSSGAPAATTGSPSRPERGDAFTNSISTKHLTPVTILFALLVAFAFGALHALSPGHGKAMVAAYLVGARGTARHAAILGLTVTITHTFTVFLLGFVTLVAANYILPERLFSILSIVSGLMVFGVGVWLLSSRLKSAGHSHDHHHHDHDHSHHHDHDHSHDHDHVHSHHHDHDHSHDDHDHAHQHDHDHDHHDYHDHSHSHGGHHHHHHVPEGPVTLKGLIALGISGGIVPCPTALVVLLSAIALRRVAFGLALITAFSLGLASVLVGIGLLIVYSRGFLNRLPGSGKLIERLPIASAVAITLIGVVLVVKSLGA